MISKPGERNLTKPLKFTQWKTYQAVYKLYGHIVQVWKSWALRKKLRSQLAPFHSKPSSDRWIKQNIPQAKMKALLCQLSLTHPDSQWNGRAQQMEVQFAGLDPPQHNRIIYRVRANWLGWPHPGAGQGCPSQPQHHPGLELLMQPHIPGSCEPFWVPDGCHLTVWGRMLKSGRETFLIFNLCLKMKALRQQNSLSQWFKWFTLNYHGTINYASQSFFLQENNMFLKHCWWKTDVVLQLSQTKKAT